MEIEREQIGRMLFVRIWAEWKQQQLYRTRGTIINVPLVRIASITVIERNFFDVIRVRRPERVGDFIAAAAGKYSTREDTYGNVQYLSFGGTRENPAAICRY